MLFGNDLFNFMFGFGCVALVYVTIVLCILGIIRLISNPSKIDLIKKEYEERISAYKDQIKELNERIDLLKKLHKEELEKHIRADKRMRIVYAAIESGAAKLVCPVHNEELEILLDGTMICRKGHQIQLTGGEEEIEKMVNFREE